MPGPNTDADRDVLSVAVDVTSRQAIDEWLAHQSQPLELGVDVAPTPWPMLNRCCRDAGGGMGIGLGWHVIVAGNTGHGKSLCGLNMAAEAMKAGMMVGFVSLEMSVTQLETRFHAILTGMQVAPMERGRSWDYEHARRAGHKTHQIARKAGASFIVNEDLRAPMRYWHEVRDLMDEWREVHGVCYFVLDYMQMIGASELATDEIAKSVGVVSRATVDYAKQHQVITIGISQFNRKTSDDYERKPRPQGLFGWSGMENDAHIVAMIDHSRYRPVEGGARTWLLAGKNRHGGKPEVPIYVDHRNLRIREALEDEVPMWPGADK